MIFSVYLFYERGKKLEQKWIIFLFLGYTYNMIKPTKNIKDVKQMVRACAEQRVAVKVNLGRNKIGVFRRFSLHKQRRYIKMKLGIEIG